MNRHHLILCALLLGALGCGDLLEPLGLSKQAEEQETVDVVIQVEINHSPEVPGLVATPCRIEESGGMVALDLTTYDPDGDPLSYQWEMHGGSGGTFEPSAQVEDPTARVYFSSEDEQVTFQCTITDDHGGQNTAALTIWLGPDICGGLPCGWEG